MTNNIDLHIHTTASDGSDSPAELVEKIKAAGIDVFSVTDHDTIEGALETEPLASGLTFIRGVEFSCVSPGGKCHILGYGYDLRDPVFQAALDEGRRLRAEKLERRIRHLAEHFGIRLTEEELRWLHGQKSPGKPHLGRILVEKGAAPDLDCAIKTYLNGVRGRDRIEAEMAVRAILHAGGVPVWAHPLGGEGERRLSRAEFSAQLAVLTGYGIRGLECWYGRYSLADVTFLREQAERHGLLVSGGSDYHGANKKNLELGQLNTENAPAEGINLLASGVGKWYNM